ncbi:hypothetical protein BCV69DRAFT_142638 [Microstroma glucosiphilum]|uniref:PWWP domain-containing protein n=1 Tax=Pseudomicrostroma glucosiphilum TaxID=1684307 RepID=A0A316UAY9_9BASI|nr:hypothetical protein BCV69DRAFT_142638 [Pseudomicrostroma glucosiphilum]PWN22390.1 hypothetical protein BCV69DRAFT_142638 [Pseudomicrostroma glucosiphilum]
MAGPSSKKGKDSSGSSGHKFQVGDVVLAKIKGFPAWPGVLVGEDQVPEVVLSEKPKNTFIIRFFPKADYHFPKASDLTLLTRAECKAYAEDTHRKDGELKAAYKIGADPDDWISETDAVVREAEKARKEALLEEEENEDQLAEDDEEPKPKKPASKKRSAAPAKPSSSAATKKAKTEAKDAKGAAPRKSVGGDDEGDDAELDEATKKVKGWRHALQRAFLPKGRDPTEQDVQGQDETFTTVENADITSDQLKATKIGKVMRKIISLEHIPTDDVHHFKERAEALINKWSSVSQPSAAPESAAEKKPAVDGDASVTKAEAGAETNGNGDADVGDLTEIADTTAAPVTNGSD